MPIPDFATHGALPPFISGHATIPAARSPYTASMLDVVEHFCTSPDRAKLSTRYFALSWMPTPDVLLATVRAHWAIENALHWQLDVSFREDAARNRKDNSPGNIAVLRRRALDVMRRDTSNGSLSIKLKRAGWDDDFLRSVLNSLAA